MNQNQVNKDRNRSIVITLLMMIMMVLLFLLPAFTVKHPTPMEKELEMLDLSSGFSVNNDTGGGSKAKEVVKPTPTPPKKPTVTETPVKEITPPKSIETQEVESPIETTPPKPVETPTPEPEPEKALYDFGDTEDDTSDEANETDNDTRSTAAGRGIGSGKGDGNGSGENGYGGIGLGGALKGRQITNPSSPLANCPLTKQETVVLKVTVNSEGKVIDAEPDYIKTKTSNSCLLAFSISYAKKLIWNESNYSKQSGTIELTFKP